MVVTINPGAQCCCARHDSFWSVTAGVRRITADMDIRIDTSSDVPIRRQLIEQVIFLIATERLQHGDLLPSVRELARRLKVHHNTVSEAYQDLVRRKWLERRRGSRLMVISRDRTSDAATLDDLINRTIATARENGYSLQELRQRVRERLLAQPPDHILVVEQDEGLRELMREELRSVEKWVVDGCTREDIASTPGLAIGAMAVTAQHALRLVSPLFPKERPVVPVSYSPADEHLKVIRGLRNPSVIAVVSSSRLFLEVARSILAPAIGSRHALREVCLQDEEPDTVRGADVIFCDSIARTRIRFAKVLHYPLLSTESIAYVKTAMESYQS
jgi:DNA-binding transcriptional regulator YhcF (GntR family)